MNKVSLGLLAILISTAASAQNPTGTTTYSNDQAPIEKPAGVKLGLAYSNLSDIYTKANDRTHRGMPAGTSKAEYSGSMSMLGISLGYKDNYAFGTFGYDTSGTVYKSLNSASADSKMTIVKAQGDIVYPIAKNLSAVGGLNIAYAAGFDTGEYTTQPGTGLQIGAQYEKQGISLLVAFQTLGFNINGDAINPANGVKVETNETIQANGVVTAVSYTF